jgi:DNA polymerase III subunit epsilon
MNFVAIDFETATERRESACAVGIVTVVEGRIEENFYTLIRPPQNRYRADFIEIHGITAEMTESAPSFAQLYPELRKRLRERTLVAHNVPFDRAVLTQTMAHHHLDITDLKIPGWICTLKLARQNNFKPAGLNDCCKHLNIPLDHHNALSDAQACAGVCMRLISKGKMR